MQTALLLIVARENGTAEPSVFRFDLSDEFDRMVLTEIEKDHEILFRKEYLVNAEMWSKVALRIALERETDGESATEQMIDLFFQKGFDLYEEFLGGEADA